MEIIKKAIECHKKGDFTQAEEYYKLYLTRHPKESKAYHLLGAMYMQKGDLSLAAKTLEQAYLLESSIPIETDLALCYYKAENFSKAFEHLKNIVNTSNISKDENKILLETISKCAGKLNKQEECLKYLIQSIDSDENDIFKFREIANLAFDCEQFDIAKKYFKKTIEMCPDDFVAYNNLGLVYEYTNDFDNAEAAYRKAIDIRPNLDPYYNLSIILKRKKRYKESLEVLMETKKFKTTDFEKFNHAFGLLHLIQKDFSGYKPYMSYTRQKYTKDMELWWQGGADKNATLVICATEGYGDIIMFTRYLDFINAEDFKQVIIIVPKELLDLYTYNFPHFKVLEMGTFDSISYNAGTILMDLPLIFNLDFEHIPSSNKYLLSPPEYTEKWQNKFGKEKGDKKLNIGLFFAGNTKDKRTLRNRKVPFNELLPLLEIENVNFYSLQPENTFKTEFEGYSIKDLSSEIKNFSDTAAIIDEMDIVISVDSSVIHLAGALGKKAYLMLPYSADWRWFDDTKSTPWYDSVQIFRQQKEGDWPPVIHEIKQNLEKIIN